MSEARHPAPYGLDETLFVTFYHRPNGRSSNHAITNVDPEEVKYFNDNRINVSMEDCGAFLAIYACREGFEYDITQICSVNADCVTELKVLRRLCEEHIANEGWTDTDD